MSTLPRPMTDVEKDLHERWRPSKDQLFFAAVLLDADGVEHVIVPLVMPGKMHGVWTMGQEVVPVAGFWVVCSQNEYVVGRNGAMGAADSLLREVYNRDGTVAHVVISIDSSKRYCAPPDNLRWAVFEY